MFNQFLVHAQMLYFVETTENLWCFGIFRVMKWENWPEMGQEKKIVIVKLVFYESWSLFVKMLRSMKAYFVGNKAKGWISKRALQENKHETTKKKMVGSQQ